MSLTTEQIAIIKATAPVVLEYGTAITTSFYSTIIEELPALSHFFNRANQARNTQQTVLATALYAYAANIDNLEVLLPAVEKICQKHTSLYVQPEQYAVVGEYLLRAMSEVLQTAFTAQIREAWGAAYWQLANLMINRESEIYKSSATSQWSEFRIVDKVKESAVITSFCLKPVDGQRLPKALPGQYISVLVNESQPRHYSISDVANGDSYRISVKRESGVRSGNPSAVHPGLVSNILHNEKQIGDIIKVSHPSGTFTFDPDMNKVGPVVLIAAGIGATPMMAILNTLVDRRSKQRISFIHGANSRGVRAFADHIQGLTEKNTNIAYTSFLTKQELVESPYQEFWGHIDLQKLDSSKDLCLDSTDSKYFVCGPDGFMADMVSSLLERGVRKEQIKTESFKPSL